VVRAGPPPRSGRWREWTAAAIGVLLILSCGVLAVRLPKVDTLPPQYKVTFGTETHDLPQQNATFSLTEGARNHDFLFDVPDDDVVLVRVSIHFVDNVPASDPDRFAVALYDPFDTPEGAPSLVSNPYPVQNQTVPTQYDALPAVLTIPIALKAQPQDTIVTQDNTTEDAVAAQQEALNHFGTKGSWRLHVTYVGSGDCPQASAAARPDDVARSVACYDETSGNPQQAGKDLGNDFTVGSFTYQRFTVSAKRLD